MLTFKTFAKFIVLEELMIRSCPETVVNRWIEPRMKAVKPVSRVIALILIEAFGFAARDRYTRLPEITAKME